MQLSRPVLISILIGVSLIFSAIILKNDGPLFGYSSFEECRLKEYQKSTKPNTKLVHEYCKSLKLKSVESEVSLYGGIPSSTTETSNKFGTLRIMAAFMMEHTVINSIPILIGILIIVGFFGKAIKEFQSNWKKRTFVYSFFGVVCGLWSYSSLTIPDRQFEGIEVALLGIGMFLFSMMFVYPSAYFKNRNIGSINSDVEKE